VPAGVVLAALLVLLSCSAPAPPDGDRAADRAAGSGTVDPAGGSEATAPSGAGDAPASRGGAALAGVGPFGHEARHLSAIRQLTSGGQNAEAYFGPGDSLITYQATPDSGGCDQIYTMRPDGSGRRRVSTGEGVTTCSHFLYPAGERLIYSSTHLAGPACPPRPSYERGYVWPLHRGYDVFSARADGSDLRRITDTPGYDAEATVSRDGGRVVFTSVRDGDLDIYTMDPEGGSLKRLTDEPGYDGGAFFSYDGSTIVYRAHHPEPGPELDDYRALLAEGLVRPTRMEIWVMDADGSNKRQVTDNGAANFAPYFFPDGERIVFASNLHDPRGRNFDLYAVRVDGGGLERLTFHPDFDAFPMFSSDGRTLIWASNRNAGTPGETNVFVAAWRD
jgi:Tol biopolymer transport system component